MSKQSDSCIFCKIARKEIKDSIIKEGDNFIAIKDIKPLTEGHILVIPKQHFVTLLDIPTRLGGEMLEFTKQVASEIMDKKQGDGFNLIMNNLAPAGQVVMHVHIHIVPRKEGDKVRAFVREGK